MEQGFFHPSGATYVRTVLPVSYYTAPVLEKTVMIGVPIGFPSQQPAHKSETQESLAVCE